MNGRQGGGFSFEEGGLGSVFLILGVSHFSASLIKCTPWVVEKRIELIFEPWIREEQCWFRMGRKTLEQLHTLWQVLEASWEFAH